MEGIISLLAIGLSICVIFLIAHLWDERQHRVLKYGLTAFAIILLSLTGKVALDFNDHCDLVVNESIVSGTSTIYTYDYVCITKTQDTNTQLYKTVMWLWRLIPLYFAMFGFFYVFQIDMAKLMRIGRK